MTEKEKMLAGELYDVNYNEDGYNIEIGENFYSNYWSWMCGK